MGCARDMTTFVNEIVKDTVLQISEVEQCLTTGGIINHKKICKALDNIKELGEILSPDILTKQSEHLTILINSQEMPLQLSPNQINYLISELEQIKQSLTGKQVKFSPISINDFSRMSSKS